MTDDIAAVVLAAGAGTRLRPLTDIVPKALCPVNNVPLVDLALETVSPHTRHVAVNVHHGRDAMERHLAGRAHLSFEEPEPLGSAGAVGALRDWIDGRDVLIVNADRYHRDDLRVLVGGWGRVTARLLVVEDDAHADFETGLRFAGASLLPWRVARQLPPSKAGLMEACWTRLRATGRLELVRSAEPFVDCGRPADYWRANMLASGNSNVVGAGAVVEGTIERCVVWPHARVEAGERLIDAIRAPGPVTVLAR